ncbi:MAG: carbohydrate porin [Alphaproteobacteria bacterium]|nr:carbohydrate porin [Alphaproteobacteria bacterium]
MAAPTPQPPGIPVTPEQAAQIEIQNWAVHEQATVTWMLQPAFRAPYTGPQSLQPNANGRETVDATLYAGFRPWPGGEIWINPEVDQGFGLSNTFGVAGYPSGEAYKLGKAYPYVLVQRGFLRQTIDLGGATERLEPDLNQLGGAETANHLVFTIGKYSVVDIFDTNKYAHDPRNDFLNWSIIDMGSFDYAANSWGYSYGGTAEWRHHWWTFRTGVFDLPARPNSDALSPNFAQLQFVTELEARYHPWDQPGNLKLLYWIVRGNLGTYLDAISLGEAVGEPPSTAGVRTQRTKDGIGLNLAQQIAPDLGVFARASVSQGTVEEIAFTDINRSISGGLSLGGSRWGRPDDTFGLAGAINRISHQGKLYLAAGGLGGIIGDGELPNAGPEQILETYYRLPILGFAHVAFDYQFINNPAYNRDRGPVSVFILQLHLQY